MHEGGVPTHDGESVLYLFKNVFMLKGRRANQQVWVNEKPAQRRSHLT